MDELLKYVKNPIQRAISIATSMIGGRAGSLILVLCVLAGSALGLLIVPRAPDSTPSGLAAPALIFMGQPLALSPPHATPDQTQAMIERAAELARSLGDKTFTVTVPGSTSLALPLSRWGISIDEERLQRLIRDSLDPSSPQSELWMDSGQQARANAISNTTLQKELPILVEIDDNRVATRLEPLKEAIDHAPESARFDVISGQVLPHLDGQALDIWGTVLALAQAVQRGENKVEARVIVTAAPRRADELAKLSFPKVLGHFETRYSRSDKAIDRTFNLRLAAKRLDGTVLLPGEEFDFNAVVGPRDEAHGYKVATVIADGELVDGIGGGTCQISGTLHGAAFFSGLAIEERYPHTRPSSYIKMGMDATVVYPTINFRFRNPFDFPVVIHQIVEDGRVYAEIRGGDVDQVVSLIRKIDSAIPYEELERNDDKLPRGSRVLAQRGVPGFRLHRYRTVRRGSHTKREKWRDIYPPTAQVVRVGTGAPSQPSGKSVTTPEYNADEVLILTLKRAANGSAGEFAENREAGKYGIRGWTKAAGMPFWDRD